MSILSDTLRSPAARRVLLGVAFVTILIGIGMATYFLGGDKDEPSGPVEKTALIRRDEGADRGGFDVVDALELPWGTGDDAVPMSPSEERSTLDTVFLGSEGRIYVVDHLPGRVGARVRWFRDGALGGVHHAPGGSTHFTADGEGFMYALAKSVGPSERVVVVDRDGSVTATYSVPMRANSGGLVRADDTLYARAYHSQADPDAKTLDAQDVLLPVAIGGKQADEAAAEAGIVDAWTLLDGGVKVKSRLAGEATETKEMQIRRYVRYGADGEIEAPEHSALIGASKSDPSMWLLLPPRPLEVRGTPGSPVLFEAEGLVLRIDPKGTVLSTIPVAMPRIANPEDLGWTGRVSTDGDRLIAATASDAGVRILVFGRK